MSKKSQTFKEYVSTLETDEKKKLFKMLSEECLISENSLYRYAAGTLKPSPPAAILIGQKMFRDPFKLFPNIKN